MCPYINLVHEVQLRACDAQVSFAAPLTYNSAVRAGVLVYNDMFTIYPYENQLYKLELSGREIKDYLEYSYNLWLAAPGGEHILRISPKDNPAPVRSAGPSMKGRIISIPPEAWFIPSTLRNRSAKG